MDTAQTLSRIMLDRDPTPDELNAFDTLGPEDVAAMDITVPRSSKPTRFLFVTHRST